MKKSCICEKKVVILQRKINNIMAKNKSSQLPKIDKSKRPCGKTYELYNFNTAPVMLSRTAHGCNYRLEHYFFHCYRDGSYEFEFQEGWAAGSHNDGGTAYNDIPEEWLALSWEEFVDRFSHEYPDNEYFITRYELLTDDKLKAFLGF